MDDILEAGTIERFSSLSKKDGKIVLDQISTQEHWIYKNPEALASLMRGIEDAKNGRIVNIDIDFSQ